MNLRRGILLLGLVVCVITTYNAADSGPRTDDTLKAVSGKVVPPPDASTKVHFAIASWFTWLSVTAIVVSEEIKKRNEIKK